MYQNYVFDLYGTLVDIRTDEQDERVWEKLRLFYGFCGADYTSGELRKSYERLVSEAREESRGRLVSEVRGMREAADGVFPEIQIERVFRALFAEKGVEPEASLVLRAGQFFRILSMEYIRLYEGAAELLESLKARGKRLYLLSNAQRIFTEPELRLLGLEPYFDGIMLSSDWGVRKPDRRFFEILLGRFELDPGECVMIGNDGLCDMEGARRAGMATCYVRSNLSPREDSPEADFVVEEMELAGILRRI